MINPKELRIGNLVETYTVWNDGRGNWSEPGIRIKEVDLKDLDIMQSPLATYRAVPITEEWLIKFGFKSQSSAWFEKDQLLFLFGYTDSFGHYLHFAESDRTIVGTGIKYVHQLQNLYYSLTGEELEINK